MQFARTLVLVLSFLTEMPHVVEGQAANEPAAGAVFAVGYVETQAKQADAGRAALARYRRAVERQPGCLSVELFAQTERLGHFAVVETWRDQAAFDGRDTAAKRELMESLAPIRVSDYDERPYKPLTLAPEKTAVAATSNAYVIAHVDVAPNSQAPMLLQQLAAASRQEPGNFRFDVLQHATRGNHFTVVEQWRDQSALDAHVATVHARAYRDALQPLTGSPLDERVYKPARALSDPSGDDTAS